MNQTIRQRIDYLDVMKGFAIITVILGHCCTTFSSEGNLGMIVNWWLKIIYSFHMPLFFVATGVVSHPQKKYSGEHHLLVVKKNFYALLMPYILFSLFYMPFSITNFGRIAYGSSQMIKASGIPCTHLWFLPCLFAARILMTWLFYLVPEDRNDKLFCLISAVAAFAIGFGLPKLKMGYPFTFNSAFIALGFMLVGYIMREKLKELDGKNILFQVGIFAVSGTLLVLGNLYGTPENFFAGMFNANYGPAGWFLLNAFAGIITVRALSSMIAKINLNSAFAWIRSSMTWLGKNTIGIFLLHMPFNLFYIVPWMERTFHLQRGNLGDSCLMTLVILLGSILGTIIINKVFPPLFGREMPAEKRTTADK